MQAEEEKKREERRKLLACKKELEDAWRKKECARLEFDTNELKAYMTDLYNYWDDQTAAYRRDVYNDSVEIFNAISAINMDARQMIRTSKQKRVWDSYVNTANAANEETLIITTNDFIHLVREVLYVEPEPSDIDELRIRVTRVDKTDSFLEICSNLFEVYISMSKECIRLFNLISSAGQQEKTAGLIQYCQQKPIGMLSKANGGEMTMLTETSIEYNPDILKNEIGSEVAETIIRDVADNTNTNANTNTGGVVPKNQNEEFSKANDTRAESPFGNMSYSARGDVSQGYQGVPMSRNGAYPEHNTLKGKTIIKEGSVLKTQSTQEILTEIKENLRVLFLQLLDKATKYAIQHPTLLGGTEMELELQQTFDYFSFGLWSNPQRNVRKRTLQFSNMGVTIHLSKQISVSSLALRFVMVNCDLFESQSGVPLGFTGLISLLGIPPQPIKAGLWTVETNVQKTSAGKPIYLHHLAYPLKSAEYPVSYPGCYWEDQVEEGTSFSSTPRGPQAAASGQSITIDLALQAKNVMPSNPLVAIWGQDHSSKLYGWTNDDIELFYTPEKRLISFTTTRIGPMAIILKPGASIPYMKWSIRPLYLEEATEIMIGGEADANPEKLVLKCVTSLKMPSNMVQAVIIKITLPIGLDITIAVGENGVSMHGIPSLEGTLFGTVGELLSAAKVTGISLEPNEADAATYSRTECSPLLEEVLATQLALLVCVPIDNRVVKVVESSEWNRKFPIAEEPPPEDVFESSLLEFEKINKESKGWIDPDAPQKKKKKKAKSKGKSEEDMKKQGPDKKKQEPEREDPTWTGPLGYTPVHVTRSTDAFQTVQNYCRRMRERLGPSDIVQEGSIFKVTLSDKGKVTATRAVTWPPTMPQTHPSDPVPTKAMAEAKLHEPPPRNNARRGAKGKVSQVQRGPIFKSLKDPSIIEPLPTSEHSTPNLISKDFNEEISMNKPIILLARCDDRLGFRILPVPENPGNDDRPCLLPAPGTKITGTLLAMFNTAKLTSFIDSINSVVAIYTKELLHYLRVASFG